MDPMGEINPKPEGLRPFFRATLGVESKESNQQKTHVERPRVEFEGLKQMLPWKT